MGGYRKLEVLAGFLGDKQSYWRAESKNKIIYLHYYSNTISVGLAETEYQAQQDSLVIGSFNPSVPPPTTKQIIDFMKWQIRGDQIMEFSDN
jgi:hypothetical protein